MDRGYDLRTPGDAAAAIAGIEEEFSLGTNNDLRTDLDEIRMAFEALDAFDADGYTELRRPANGTGEVLISRIDADAETVTVYRADDADARLSAREQERELGFENLRRGNDER